MNEQSDALEELASRFHVGDKKFNIGKIKVAHLAWRTALEAVIRGVKTMQPEEVTSHTECELGKWYFGPGKVFANIDAYKEMNIWHEKVHAVAKETVALCARGKNEEAVPLLEDFREAREKLFELIDILYLS